VTEVGASQRVALGVAYGSERLRSEGCCIEEPAEGLGTRLRLRNLIGTVCTTTTATVVLRGGPIVVAEAFGIVSAKAAVDDGEGFPTLRNRDYIGLPAGEERLLDASELFAVLQFVVEREGEAVLDVVFGLSVLDLADLVGIRVAICKAL
jgi:hypothetical protein